MTLYEMQVQPNIEEVSVVPRGHIRITTMAKYCDGASVEVFIHKGQPDYTFTDFGHTFNILDQHGIDYVTHLDYILRVLKSQGVVLENDTIRYRTIDFNKGVNILGGVSLSITSYLINNNHYSNK